MTEKSPDACYDQLCRLVLNHLGKISTVRICSLAKSCHPEEVEMYYLGPGFSSPVDDALPSESASYLPDAASAAESLNAVPPVVHRLLAVIRAYMYS